MCEHGNFGICTCVILSASHIIIIAYKIPGLSRTLHSNFQDFPGPNPFSRTFQDLKIVPKKIQDFSGLSRSAGTL